MLHIDSRSYFALQTTKVSFVSLKFYNLIVAKSEVQFLFALETPPLGHPYRNRKPHTFLSSSPNLTVYFRIIITDVFIQIQSFYGMITFL
jgi:hypothetical protein